MQIPKSESKKFSILCTFKCGRDVTLREQLYNKDTSLPSRGLNLHGVETAKLRRWNLELVLCVMKRVFSKFHFV
jgi:hypothetical protein